MSRKIFIAVSFLVAAGFMFNFSTPTAKAMTTAEIQALIQSLQQQILQLQKQLAEKTEEPAAWCHDFNKNLKFGDGTGEAAAKEDEVRNLQVALEKDGFEVNDDEQKGGASFEESTASAVVGFQQKYKDEVLTPWGLKNGTGYVGKSTRAKLNKLYGCGVTAAPTPIETPIAKPITPSITVISPNGGETLVEGDTYNIIWRASNVWGWADIYIVNEETGQESSIRTRVSQIGRYEWTVGKTESGPAILAGQKYKILVKGILESGSYVKDESDNSFSIVSSTKRPPFTVLSPNGGETLVEGQTHNINWQSSYDAGWVEIYIINEKTGQKSTITERTSPVGGRYNWTVGKVESGPAISVGEKYKISVKQIVSIVSYAEDKSDNYFSIISSEPTSGTITVLSPNGGEEWEVGKNYEVKLYCSGISKTIDIWLTNKYAEGGTVSKIADGVTCRLGAITAYSFTVPNIAIPQDPTSFKVAARTIDGAVQDESNNYFSIVSQIVYTANTVPEMAYPQDGQVLNYGYPHAYMFKVNPILRASGYRFMFYQNGALLYDNLRDQGQLSSNGEFAFWPGDKGYSLFQRGDVKVEIRALVSNNWTSPRIITIKLSNPDLQPTPISYSTSLQSKIPTVGEIVYFDSGVRNNGGVGTEIFNVKWFVDDVQAGYGSHSGVSGNSTVMDGNSQFNWTAVEGTHTIKFVVDTDNFVAESDETNNSAAATLTIKSASSVTLPDLVVTDLTWTPLYPTSGQWISFVATVKNAGLVDVSSPFSVNLGGIASTIPSLKAGATAQVTANFGLTIIGPNTVSVRVDIWDNIAESNEQNNDYSETVTVVSTPSITVLSPSGSSLLQGQQTTITWTTQNYSGFIGLDLFQNDNFIVNIATNISDIGYYIWTVPTTLSGSGFKIRAVLLDTKAGSVVDFSDAPLSIIAPITPSITVTSPNGGEQWTFGTPQTITWTSTGMEKGMNASIYLQFPNGTLCYLTSRNALDGIQTVTLQQNQQCSSISYTITPGQYKVLVYWESSVKDQKAQDYSDNYFSIVAGDLGFKNLENKLASISQAITGLLEEMAKISR